MRVVETCDSHQFEPYCGIGINVELATKLFVAGKSIAPALTHVKLTQPGSVKLFETLVKGLYGSLLGLIESDRTTCQDFDYKIHINNWVKAGAFDEEMRGYAETVDCVSHVATYYSEPSTCYGALYYYLEVCDLTDPMVSNSTKSCHLDAMFKRVKTGEDVVKFLELLVQNNQIMSIWRHILSDGFINLNSDVDGRKVVEQFLRNRPEAKEMALILERLGLWRREVWR